MSVFLVACGVVVLLIAGGIALNVLLYNKLYKGQPWRGSRLFYPVSRGYATDSNIDLADVNMARSGDYPQVEEEWRNEKISSLKFG